MTIVIPLFAVQPKKTAGPHQEPAVQFAPPYPAHPGPPSQRSRPGAGGWQQDLLSHKKKSTMRASRSDSQPGSRGRHGNHLSKSPRAWGQPPQRRRRDDPPSALRHRDIGAARRTAPQGLAGRGCGIAIRSPPRQSRPTSDRRAEPSPDARHGPDGLRIRSSRRGAIMKGRNARALQRGREAASNLNRLSLCPVQKWDTGSSQRAH